MRNEYYSHTGKQIVKTPKNGLTKHGCFDILNKLSASDAPESTILENDTENVQTVQETVRFGRVKRLDEVHEEIGFGELVLEGTEFKIRIEHQSLILAQDERWRRA